MSNTHVPLPEEYYADKFKQHGATPASVDLTPEGQELRFKLLCSAIGSTFGKSVLDVGCGYGAFRPWVLDGEYTGIDICPELITAAKDSYPNATFYVRDIVKEPLPRKFNFVVASGLFQFNHGWQQVECLIKAMWDHTEEVLAFNMLSRKTPMQSWVNEELHAWPERVLSECFELTNYVEVDHGYRDNDFTVVMRRAPRVIQNVGKLAAISDGK